MVNPAVEAATAEALFKLLYHLRLRPHWWQRRRCRERLNAIREYLATVCKAHLLAMLEEVPLPDEEASEKRLAEAIEHAVAAAGDPEVASLAAKVDRTLADVWRVGYTAERARRWRQWQTCPINPIHTTPEREAHEAEARAELARRREQSQQSEKVRAADRTGNLKPEEVADEDRRRLLEERARLLADYKAATGASDYAIYNARGRDGHTCRKAEFYAWKNG